VIHDLMGIVAGESIVGEQRISVEGRSRFDVLANLSLKDGLLATGDYRSADLPTAFEDADNSSLVFGSGSGDATLAFGDMHVASLATDESLIDFYAVAAGANQLHHGAVLHRLANPMQHEPGRLLSDAQGAGDLTGTNSIFRAGNNPDSGEPLFKSQRRVFKDGSNLCSKLPFRMSTLALKLSLILKPRHVSAPASRARNAIRPTMRDHIAKAILGVCEVNDGFLKSLWAAHELRIELLS